ncbi:hypothetical protein MANES_07G010500v8 [Manihot esculenta]|nr:hypothetical protein MANES_07G010500v8 [Manihot esculenta]
MKKNVGAMPSIKVCVRPPSTCLNHEPEVYGRDEDKRKLLDLVLRNETSDLKVGVIPIVGIGGVGKTTLARLVYNDEASQQQFQVKAWVCVSDEFDIVRITKSILESITLKSCDLKELNQVQLKLHDKLAEKKFLIVLDDVWNKNYDDWNALCSPLMYGAPGSRVIITTRDEAVARTMGNMEFQTLSCISDEGCWSIFIDHAFGRRRVAGPNLEVIYEKVIKKCGGLPLAARTLGGLLRSKPMEEWENVLNSKIWNLQGGVNNILPVLRLSYYHLPSHLKRCFAYCAIFPKDYVFQKKQLVLLWMAEGLIQQQDNQHMEDVGDEYFRDLCSRSFFQSSSTGGFIMHDLVNDLAQSVAGETCFRLEDSSMVGQQFEKEKVRHFSYTCRFYDRIERFEPFLGIKCLRTFLPFLPEGNYGSHHIMHLYYLASCIPPVLLSKLRCLRVLSFRYYKITELPDSIGDLKHLRYLDLSYTNIVTLPESTTSLCNLQSMLLKGCHNLKKLPSEMQNLINLRHLDIKGVRLDEGMPLGIEELRGIRTLSNFVVEKSSEAGITALLNLKFLRGALRISMLQNVANALDVREPILMDKERIDSLAMGWGFQNTPDESRDRDVLDRMKPHENLKKLTIIHYGGTEFPWWVGDPVFRNLVCLKLEDCKKCTTLPQLGLLSSLKNLVIKKFPNVTLIDREFYGESNLNPFPSLETLQFKSMHKWDYWNTCGVEFPRLRELSIVWCPKLSGQLPSQLPSLQTLVIEQCLQLIVSLQSLPEISHLEIEGCRKLEVGRGFSSANLMKVYGESIFFPPEEFMEGLRKLEMLTIGRNVQVQPFLSCPCSPHWVLFEGIIENEELLQKGIIDSKIKILEFRRCKSLDKLPSWIHSFKSLRQLSIEGCTRLVSLPEAMIYSSICLEVLQVERCDSLVSIGRHQLPPTVKRLEISRCQKLQRLLHEEVINYELNLSNLQHIKIDDCGFLTCLGKLPPSLKDLVITSFGFGLEIGAKLESIAESFNNNTSLESIKIGYLPKLKTLPENLHMLGSLHDIWIYNCPSLVSFPRGGLPTLHLKSLTIDDCEKLKALPDNMYNLTSLQELTIKNCPRLVCFPRGVLPTAHLKKLRVESCEKLKALPHNMHNLTSLQELTLKYCPGIVSFPEEGFPTNLRSLCIHKLEILKPIFGWGLHRLTSLKKLSVSGTCLGVVSFPQDEMNMKLPSSLTSLTVEGFLDLIYLSNKGFQNLTSLEYLRIERCPKLAYFPKNGLPPSLLQLHIHHCPLLRQTCQKGKGGKSENSELAQIPLVFLIPTLKRKNDQIKA